MLPDYDNDTLQNLETITMPSKTYALDIGNNCINGLTDGLEAVKQAVYLILSTERYMYAIYSWNYGVEFSKCLGMQTPLLYSLLQDCISEALLQDDRITKVSGFDFQNKKDKVKVSFTVESTEGEFESETEVVI